MRHLHELHDRRCISYLPKFEGRQSRETADEHVRSKNSWDTKRAALKAVANLQAAKKVDDHEKNLTHVKGSMKKYGVFAGVAL